MRKGFHNKGTSQRWANFIKNPNQEKNKRIIDSQKVYVANTHLYEENNCDIVLNHELFADEKVDQYLKVTEINKKQSWIVKLTNDSFKEKNIKNIQSISLIRIMTDMNQIDYDIGFKFSINIQKLITNQELQQYHLESIEVTIKDQFISRRNQWILNKKIVNTATYPGQYIQSRGIKAQVSNLICKGQIINSGIITGETRIIYRSYSSQQSILIEVSKEQLETDWSGEIIFDKTVKFLRVFFLRNQFIQTTHKYMIILYARLFYPQFNSLEEAYILTDKPSAYQINENGRVYQDIYRSIALKIPISKYHNKNIQLIQKTFKEFVSSINWQFDKEGIINYYSQNQNIQQLQNGCKLAQSEQCNLLEAINLICLQHNNEIQQPQLDHSGHNVIVLSAGEMNYICFKEMQRITKQNVLFSNLFLYLISFNNKPLFSTPSFVIKNVHKDMIIDSNNQVYKEIIEKSLFRCMLKKQMIKNSHIYVIKDNKVQLKNFINLQNIKISDKKKTSSNQILVENKLISRVFDIEFECGHSQHYVSKQFYEYLLNNVELDHIDEQSVQIAKKNSNIQKQPSVDYSEKMFIDKSRTKQQYWIKSFFFSDLGLQTHNQVFEKFIDDPLLNLITTPSLLSLENISKPTKLSKTLQKIKLKNKDQINQETNPTDEFIHSVLNEDSKSYQIENHLIYEKNGNNVDASGQINSKSDEMIDKFREFDQNVFLLKQNKNSYSQTNQGINIQKHSNAKINIRKETNLEDSMKQSYPSVDEILEETKKKHENHVNIFKINYYNSQEHSLNKLKPNVAQKYAKNMQFDPEAHRKFVEKNMKSELKRKKYRTDYKHRLEENDQTHLQFYMSQFNSYFKQKMNEDNEDIKKVLEYEKLWKNLTFPMLLSLFNKYKQEITKNGVEHRLNPSIPIDKYLEQVIGARLTQNFQIFDNISNQRFKLSKGSQIHDIQQEQAGVIKFNIINSNKKIQKEENSIVYKFLLFEERQNTFGVQESVFDYQKNRQWKNFDFFIGGYEDIENKQDIQYRQRMLFDIMKTYYPKQIKLAVIPQIQNKREENINKIENNLKNMLNMLTNIKNNYQAHVCKEIQFYSKEEFKKINDKFGLAMFSADEYQISRDGNYYLFLEYQQKAYSLAAFQLNIYWLTTSSPIVAEFIKQLNLIAKKLDLKILTLPYVYGKASFQNITLIPLKNKLSNNILRNMVTQKPFHFVDDWSDSFDKYLHEKGYIFLEFFNNKILWKELLFFWQYDNNDNINICENLFQQFLRYIMVIEMIADIIDKVID